MRCRLKKPEACFRCPFPDCIDGNSRQCFDEMLTIMASGVDAEAHSFTRCEYQRAYYLAHRDEKRQKSREQALNYYRLHRDLINQKKRERRKMQRCMSDLSNGLTTR